MTRPTRFLGFAWALLSLFTACSNDTRSGSTACGAIFCEAGQYCSESLSCVAGCIADTNCRVDEYCDRSSRCSRTSDAVRQPNPCEIVAQQLLDCGSIDSTAFGQLRSSCDQQLSNCVTSSADCSAKEECLPTPCVFDAECEAVRGDLTHEICDGGLCTLGCREDLDCGEFSRCEDAFNECFPD